MQTDRVVVTECSRCGVRTAFEARPCAGCGARDGAPVEVDGTATVVAATRTHLGTTERFAVVRFLDQLVPVTLPDTLTRPLIAGARVRLLRREAGGFAATPTDQERGA
jgi:uncharacterized OB-fold protein